MALRTGITTVLLDDTNAVTLLSGPPEDTTYVVTLSSCFMGDWAARDVRFYLDDGSTEYTLSNNLAVAPNATISVPTGFINPPIVVPHGWDLMADAGAFTAIEPAIITSYVEDTDKEWKLSAVETDNNALCILLDAPPAGRARVIRSVTYSNDDAATNHHMLLAVYDGADNHVVQLNLAAVPGETATIFGLLGRTIILTEGFSLLAWTMVVHDTGPSHWTVHYYECDAEDSGEG